MISNPLISLSSTPQTLLRRLLAPVLAAALLAPGVASAQIVGGGGSSGPPRDQRPALPPQDFVRAAYSLTGTDFVTRVRGISEKRAPRHLYGDDGDGNLLVLSDDGIVSLSPDGDTFMRIPFQRLRDAGLEEADLTGPGTRSRADGAVFTVNAAGDLVRIPEDTLQDVETAATKADLEAFARGSELTVNDLLWSNHVVWIACDGNAGLLRYDPDDGSITQFYDPIADLTEAFTGTTDAGVKSLAHESGRSEILFSVGWDVGGAEGGGGRVGGVDGDGALFKLSTRADDVFLTNEPLPRGMAALGGGAYVVAQRDGEVYWFNYTPDSKPMTLEGALNILRALVDDIDGDDAPEVHALGLAADCEGRAYLANTLGIVTIKEPERELIPGDVLLVTGTSKILRVTGFGEPMIFREGGLGQAVGEETLTLVNAGALARSPIDGHIAVADEGAHRIFRFSPDGLKLPEYEGNLPYQVGFDAEGELYYLDRSFLKDNSDDDERRDLQSNRPSVVSRPAVGRRKVHHQFEDADWGESAMAVFPDGTIMVAQVWQGIEEPEHHGRLVKIGEPAEGEVLGELEVLFNLEKPRALFVDAEGDLWIGEESTQDNVAGRLLRLRSGGAELDQVLPRAGEPNPLVVPSAISETDDGRLIIGDREADVYEGSTRTGGLFFLNKDGTNLRVLLDHPDYPQPQQVGVIYVPPFECTSYADCPLPHCREDKRVCPPSEDCEEGAATCPPADGCNTEDLQCPGVACNVETGQCEKAVRCEIALPPAPPPRPPITEDESNCLGCNSGIAARTWLSGLLRR